MFEQDERTASEGGTEGAFSYEIRLDVGLPTPLMIGLGATHDAKRDLDLLYSLILDYGMKAKAGRQLMAQMEGEAACVN